MGGRQSSDSARSGAGGVLAGLVCVERVLVPVGGRNTGQELDGRAAARLRTREAPEPRRDGLLGHTETLSNLSLSQARSGRKSAPQREAALCDPHPQVVQSALSNRKDVSLLVGKQSKVAAVAVKHQLSDQENAAVQAELRRLAAKLGGWRAVGVALGFPRISASQTIQAAATKRAGREVADRLYVYLGLDRAKFLSDRGLVSVETVAEVLSEYDWSSVGLDHAGGERVVGQIKELLSAAARVDDDGEPKSVPAPVKVPKAPGSRPRRSRS